MLRSLAVKGDVYFKLRCFDLFLDFRLKVFKHLMDLWSNSAIMLGQSINSLYIYNFECSPQASRGRFPVLDIVYNHPFRKGIDELLLTKRDNVFIAFMYWSWRLSFDLLHPLYVSSYI
jgi:hypothetical protein